jgi:hypothetical protein
VDGLSPPQLSSLRVFASSRDLLFQLQSIELHGDEPQGAVVIVPSVKNWKVCC